jgi:competence protein ComEA
MKPIAPFVLSLVLFAGAAPGLAAQSTGESPSQGPMPAAKATINLNTATAEQLQSLPGIGPKTAERVLEYRQKNGPFKKIEELMNVKGIGEKSFLKIKPLITAVPPKPVAGMLGHEPLHAWTHVAWR